MTAGTLTSETLTKAYLARIALTNAEGPAIQAVRARQHERDRRGEGARRRAGDERRRAGRCTASRCCSTTRSTCTGCRRPAARSRCSTRMPPRTTRARRQAEGGGRDHPRQDERLRAQRRVRREHARGLLVARRPGAAAVGHRQDAGRLVRRLGGGDGVRPGGDDRRHGDVDRHGADDRARPASPASSRSSRRSGASAAPACCRSPSRRTRRGRSRGRSTTRARCRRSRRDPATRRRGAPAPPDYLPACRRPR